MGENVDEVDDSPTRPTVEAALSGFYLLWRDQNRVPTSHQRRIPLLGQFRPPKTESTGDSFRPYHPMAQSLRVVGVSLPPFRQRKTGHCTTFRR